MLKKVLFNYCFDFIAYLKDQEILKIEPYNKQKFDKKVSFEEIKNLKLAKVKNYEYYLRLRHLLNEKRLYTYKELAKKLSIHPRKVASLLRNNPFLIIIPCHRVIKSNGDLSSYKLGREAKIKLLKFEGLI